MHTALSGIPLSVCTAIIVHKPATIQNFERGVTPVYGVTATSGSIDRRLFKIKAQK